MTRGAHGQSGTIGRLRRSSLLGIGISVTAFLLGLAIQVVFDSPVKDQIASTDRAVWLLAVVLVVAVCLFATAVASMAVEWDRQARESRTERSDFLATYSDTKERLELGLDRLSSGLGMIVAEYISESSETVTGQTYERTIEILSGASEEIVFLDYWIETSGYVDQNSPSFELRQSYYDTILAKVENGRVSHTRIIQVPEPMLTDALVDKYVNGVMARDELFSDYVQRLRELRDSGRSNNCTVKLACSHVRSPFVVVDRRHIIFPLLGDGPNIGELRRFGAIYIRDDVGELSTWLKWVVGQVDAASARPL